MPSALAKKTSSSTQQNSTDGREAVWTRRSLVRQAAPTLLALRRLVLPPVQVLALSTFRSQGLN